VSAITHYHQEWKSLFDGMTREQVVAALKAGRIPEGVTIPWRFAFSVSEADFIDQYDRKHISAYHDITRDLARFEAWPEGQRKIRDMLLHPHAATPVAIRTEFSRKSPPDSLPRESIGLYIAGFNEIIFNTQIMREFEQGPYAHTGLGQPFVALAHEVDHMLRMRMFPSGSIPQPFLISLYEKLARNSESLAVDELNRQGHGPYTSRTDYFLPEPYIRSLVGSTSNDILHAFISRNERGREIEQNLLGLFTEQALLNHGYEALVSVLGEQGAAGLLPVGGAKPTVISAEQQVRLDAAIEAATLKAKETAQRWLEQTRHEAEAAYRTRNGVIPTLQQRGDTTIPGLPKLNVALSDVEDPTQTALPAHLRTQTPRTLV